MVQWLPLLPLGPPYGKSLAAIHSSGASLTCTPPHPPPGPCSIAMALALPPGGKLVACDRDPRPLALAREYWAKAGVADKVRQGHVKEAAEGLFGTAVAIAFLGCIHQH